MQNGKSGFLDPETPESGFRRQLGAHEESVDTPNMFLGGPRVKLADGSKTRIII